MPDWTIRLAAPVEIACRRLEVLALREPNAGELLRAGKRPQADADAALLADVLGVPEQFEALAAAIPARVFRQALALMEPSLHLFERIREASLLPDGVATDADLPDTLTLPLPATIQIGTTWVDRLDLHEPNGLDIVRFQRAGGGTMESVVLLVSLAAGQPRAIIERVPVSVFSRAAAYALGFTIGVPQAGKTS